MQKRKFSPTEQFGLNAAERIVLEMGCIWREQEKSDFGVDAHIEIVTGDKIPTGNLIAVQVKAGNSYFKGENEVIHFYVDEDHLHYWSEHALEVIILLYHPEEACILWQWANLASARKTEKAWCIDIPKGKFFTKESMQELSNKTRSTKGYALRRRFTIDREFMKEFVDQEVYLSVDVWVNKTLAHRGIEIRFNDSDKESPDYFIGLMATSNFSVIEVINHFLPWLDFEYTEPPEVHSGEVGSNYFSAWLSPVAEAFLRLEEFYDKPTFAEVKVEYEEEDSYWNEEE
jgi:hypothetical protein